MEVAHRSRDYVDFSVRGELYRFVFFNGTVQGPDGTVYSEHYLEELLTEQEENEVLGFRVN